MRYSRAQGRRREARHSPHARHGQWLKRTHFEFIGSVIFAFVAPNQLAGVKELPSRLRVAKWGRNDSVKGAFVVNETTARFLPAIQKAVGFDSVALDFEHNTVPETDAYKADREPRKVAAHGLVVAASVGAHE